MQPEVEAIGRCRLPGGGRRITVRFSKAPNRKRLPLRVSVKLFASLRDKLPGRETGGQVDLPEGSSLADLLSLLDISKEQAQMVLVNGEQLPLSWSERLKVPLREGDTVSIFPPLAGG